ncbi:alpha/beta hydrolase family protein [Streptosporangium sp. CA-135522]|uniref:alpha/beta hydrolase family protein n=1 Tax=Streptosporangium sp. CA-135522 TaxID=3240072 RepID=UPI003D8C78A8
MEMALGVACLLALLSLVVRLPYTVRVVGCVSPAVLAVAQVLVEGARWQMIPAYALAAGISLLWLSRRERYRWPTAALGVAWLALSVATPTLLPVFGFAPPAGTHGIGTLTYHWVDADRRELFAVGPGARRELMIQIWYPAKADPAAPRTSYVEDSDVPAAVARLAHAPELAFGQLTYVTTNAVASAPVADDQRRYPVLIFLEGAMGFRQMNTFQVEDLVSHGYIVVAIDQPYTAASVLFPDGRRAAGQRMDQLKPLIEQSLAPAVRAPKLNGRSLGDGIIPYLAQDATFTLDRLTALDRSDPNGILTGRLDLGRAGAFGISLGGIVAGEACHLEPRLRACLVMDAPMTADVVRAGLRQPSMWITRDAATMRREGWPQAEIDQHQTTMRAVFDKLPSDGYFVRVPGMYHVNLTDLPSWSPLMSWLGITGPIDPERAHTIVNAYSLAFFDRHLKGLPTPQLSEQRYLDARFETRR